jgi:general secretion pathway protein C
MRNLKIYQVIAFISKYWPLAFLVVLALSIADLSVLYLRPYLIPKPIKLGQESVPQSFVPLQMSTYQVIISKNILSPDGVIPDTLAILKAKEKGVDPGAGPEVIDNVPVPSTLPITLVGTIVHSNPKKSLANIEIKSKNLNLAVRVGNTIEKMAILETVERGRIIFRNSSNNRLEFLELKELGKVTFNNSKKVEESLPGQEIKQIAPNRFEVKKSDVLKYTSDLSNVLQQAAMIPVRGPGGEIEGFRFVNIQQDSIYTQLGFQVGDVLKNVNGESIDSPAKALELYNALKGSQDIKLNVERNGVSQDMEYQIK